MQIHALFLSNKKRNLILWLTDLTVAIASYFYLTNPFYIEKILHQIDFAAIRPDVDPEIFTSPVFFEYMYMVISLVSLLTIAVIVVLHTLVFFKCYQRNRAAIAYVKIYCVLAAVSLIFWFVNNVSAMASLILLPTLIYLLVFFAERRPAQAAAVKPSAPSAQ